MSTFTVFLSGKIHNYFFAKGLDKLAEGGLMAFITDTFLNNHSNHTARAYLLKRADFVSIIGMPDNLMKDTGNTEAPSRRLIVQKHAGKEQLSDSEKLLLNTVELKNEYGSYYHNLYLLNYREVVIGSRTAPGEKSIRARP